MGRKKTDTFETFFSFDWQWRDYIFYKNLLIAG